MKRLFRAISVSVVVTLSLAAMATPAGGQERAEQDVNEILERIEDTGRITEADRSELLEHPEIAAHVIDPSGFESGTTVVATESDGSAVGAPTGPAAAAGTCKTVDAWVRATTLLGYTFYKFHHVFKWCYDGTSVYRVDTRYAYLSDVDQFANYQGIVANVLSGGSTAKTSMMQGHIVNEILEYHIGSTYPRVTIVGNATGAYIYSTSV